MRILAVLAVLAAVLVAPSSAAAQGWAPQNVPGKPGFNGRSAGVSCATATDCMAVGFSVNPQRQQRALAKAWNGSSWALKAVPAPAGATRTRLVAVSCTAADACTAVGSYSTPAEQQMPLIVRWNGTTWTRQAFTLPAGTQLAYLNDVSCTASFGCKAVGAYDTASSKSASLAAHWNGSAWALRASPNPPGAVSSSLNGISCTGAVCIAVGDSADSDDSVPDQTFAARLTGSAWSLLSLPAPAGATAAVLRDVSCSAATACTAVGGYSTNGPWEDTPLVARFNGTSWTRQATPAKPTFSIRRTLHGVSCSATSSCTAVGHDLGSGESGTVALRWNGSSWTAQHPPRAAGIFSAWLSGVSCNSGGCTAVGGASQFGESAVEAVTLAERQAAGSSTWSVQATPNVTGVMRTELMSAACTSATSCTAVGSFFGAREAGAAIARWNGTSWAHMTPGARFGSGPKADTLRDVACTAANACTAVGFYLYSPYASTPPWWATSRPEAQRYDGTSWTSAKLPIPADATTNSDVELHSVSCASATSCVAVGGYDGKPLAEHWNGTSWTVETLPAVPSGAGLKGVACSENGACIAVGGTSTGPLVLHYNGSAWSVQSPPLPEGTYQGSLGDVSCTAADACTAVGGYSAPSGPGSLVLRWNGTSWALQSAPYSGLTDISCSSLTSCVGVGPNGIAQGWNGTSWDYQGSLTGQTSNGISCADPSACTTVGHSFSSELITEMVFAGVHVVNVTSAPSALRYDPAGAATAFPAPSPGPRGLGAKVVRAG